MEKTSFLYAINWSKCPWWKLIGKFNILPFLSNLNIVPKNFFLFNFYVEISLFKSMLEEFKLHFGSFNKNLRLIRRGIHRK